MLSMRYIGEDAIPNLKRVDASTQLRDFAHRRVAITCWPLPVRAVGVGEEPRLGVHRLSPLRGEASEDIELGSRADAGDFERQQHFARAGTRKLLAAHFDSAR